MIRGYNILHLNKDKLIYFVIKIDKVGIYPNVYNFCNSDIWIDEIFLHNIDNNRIVSTVKEDLVELLNVHNYRYIDYI